MTAQMDSPLGDSLFTFDMFHNQTLPFARISILAFSDQLSACFRIMLNRPPGDDDLS